LYIIEISLTSLANGSFGISSSTDFWYCRISRRATAKYYVSKYYSNLYINLLTARLPSMLLSLRGSSRLLPSSHWAQSLPGSLPTHSTCIEPFVVDVSARRLLDASHDARQRTKEEIIAFAVVGEV
jgi:hypothetical protein